MTHNTDGSFDVASFCFLNVLNIGISKDNGIEGGVGLLNTEAHIGVNLLEKGFLISFSGGFSHTNSGGQKVGQDIEIGVGRNTVIGLTTIVASQTRASPLILKALVR